MSEYFSLIRIQLSHAFHFHFTSLLVRSQGVLASRIKSFNAPKTPEHVNMKLRLNSPITVSAAALRFYELPDCITAIFFMD